MSDLQIFESFRDKYTKDSAGTARDFLALSEKVTQDEQTDSPTLGHDAHQLSLLALAVADAKAFSGNNAYEAPIAYAEAVKQAVTARNHGEDVHDLLEISEQVKVHVKDQTHEDYWLHPIRPI